MVCVCGVFNILRLQGHWAWEAAEAYDMNTALHMAAAGGHAELCSALLEAGPSVAGNANRIGATALHMAAKGGHVSACKALLDSSAFAATNARDARGFTALHWGCHQAGHAVCAVILACKDFTALESRDLKGRTALSISEDLGQFHTRDLIQRRIREQQELIE